MIRAANLTQVTDYYKSNTVSKQNNTEKAKDVQPNAQKIKSSEDKLSSKAQKYLETLRKDNADFDFIIADKGDDFRGLVDQSDKEFTVVFSSAELERMASDEKYAREKLSTVKTAVEMSDKINEQFGFERAWGTTDNSGTVLNKLTMSFDDDGKMTLFADLEKITEKQKERLEELKEKRAEEKKQEKNIRTVNFMRCGRYCFAISSMTFFRVLRSKKSMKNPKKSIRNYLQRTMRRQKISWKG